MDQAGKEWNFEGKGRYAHSGFLSVALHLRKEIEEMGILAALMNRTHSIYQFSPQNRAGSLNQVSKPCALIPISSYLISLISAHIA
jgi:hypothetical protein